MLVLCSVLMVSGCSGGKQTEDAESKVVSEVEISEMDVALASLSAMFGDDEED